jgi:hypothetical protein
MSRAGGEPMAVTGSACVHALHITPSSGVGSELSRAARSAAGLRSLVCFRALGQIVSQAVPRIRRTEIASRAPSQQRFRSRTPGSRSACGLGRYDRCFVAVPRRRARMGSNSRWLRVCRRANSDAAHSRPRAPAECLCRWREWLDAHPLHLLVHRCYLATRVCQGRVGVS